MYPASGNDSKVKAIPWRVEHDKGSLDVSKFSVKVGVDQLQDIIGGGKPDQEKGEQVS